MKRQTRLILAQLRIHPGGITQMDALRDVGSFRLAARIGELRAAGFDIRCDRSEGFGRYRLTEQLELPL